MKVNVLRAKAVWTSILVSRFEKTGRKNIRELTPIVMVQPPQSAGDI